MAYKTVLVHCNNKTRSVRAMQAAADVAQRFQAHLVGVSVVPPVAIIPAGVPGAPDAIVFEEHCVVYRRDSPDLRAAFEAAARGAKRLWNGGKQKPAAPPSPMWCCSTPARPTL